MKNILHKTDVPIRFVGQTCEALSNERSRAMSALPKNLEFAIYHVFIYFHELQIKMLVFPQ